MLDGEGYPNAYVNMNKFRISFSEVNKKVGKLTERFTIIDEHEKEDLSNCCKS